MLIVGRVLLLYDEVYQRVDAHLHHVDVGHGEFYAAEDKRQFGTAEYDGLRLLLLDDALRLSMVRLGK
jgi:hypothetical protein